MLAVFYFVGVLAVLDLLPEHLAELDLLGHHPRFHELLLQAVLLGRPRVLHAAPEPPVELDVHRVWRAPLLGARRAEAYLMNATLDRRMSPDR